MDAVTVCGVTCAREVTGIGKLTQFGASEYLRRKERAWARAVSAAAAFASAAAALVFAYPTHVFALQHTRGWTRKYAWVSRSPSASAAPQQARSSETPWDLVSFTLSLLLGRESLSAQTQTDAHGG